MKKVRIGLIVVAAIVCIVDLAMLCFYKLDNKMKFGIVFTLIAMLLVIFGQVSVSGNLSKKKLKIWKIAGASFVSIIDMAILSLFKFETYMKLGLVLMLLGLLIVILGNVLQLKNQNSK